MTTRCSLISVLMISSTWLATASADPVDTGPSDVGGHDAAADDSFTPGLFRSSNHGQGVAAGTFGYSGAAHHTSMDVTGEVQVYGPLRLVARVDDVFHTGRPGIGAAVQWLDERKQGVSSSAYVIYKTEGFTEIEGEIEALVSFGKQFGALHTTANLAYGQDPEGAERDGEVALGLHVEPTHDLFTGIIGRYRDALGSNGDKTTGILRDALGAASATYVVGRFGVTATAGVAAIETKTSGKMQAGPSAAVSVGAVF